MSPGQPSPSYRVRYTPTARRQIASWPLPDNGVLVDVYLRIEQLLTESPTRHLRRGRRPFEGMQLRFTVPDPDNRLLVHGFVFHVLYGQDEETLWVARGGYLPRFGI